MWRRQRARAGADGATEQCRPKDGATGDRGDPGTGKSLVPPVRGKPQTTW